MRSVFKAEELAYKNDGIKWEAITYTDNSNIIEIIEGKEKGIFPSLDSVCKAPKATDETLANQLHENHGRSKILCRPKAAKGGPGGKKGLTEKEVRMPLLACPSPSALSRSQPALSHPPPRALSPDLARPHRCTHHLARRHSS